jgi:AcrR family transcriptional regulator
VAEEPPTTVRQRQAAETRLQLLSAACEVFEERGYQSTSVGAITERARTAHGTFYLYFKNKEDAFCRVMETVVLDELATSSALPDGVEPRDGVELVIRGFLSAYVPRVGLWRAVLEGMLQSDRVQELWLDLRRTLIHGIAAALEEEHRRGHTRPLDPLMTAHALASMVEWFAFMHFEMHEPPGADDEIDPGHERVVRALVDLWRQAFYGQATP